MTILTSMLLIEACLINAGLYMAFKHCISFATDLAANNICYHFRILPDIQSWISVLNFNQWLFFLGFCQWLFHTERGLTLNNNVQLLLFWSNLSWALGKDSPQAGPQGKGHGCDCSCCIASDSLALSKSNKKVWLLWPLSFLEMSKILEKQWLMLRVFQLSIPRGLVWPQTENLNLRREEKIWKAQQYKELMSEHWQEQCCAKWPRGDFRNSEPC